MDFTRAIFCLVVIGFITGNPARNRRTSTTTTTALPTFTPDVVAESVESSRGTSSDASLLARCMVNVTTSTSGENAVVEMINSLCQQYESVLQCTDEVLRDVTDEDKKGYGILGLSALLFDRDSVTNAYGKFCADVPSIEDSLPCLADNFGFDTCSSFVTGPLMRGPELDVEEAREDFCRGFVNFIKCAKPSWNECGSRVADIFDNYYTASLSPYCKQLTGVSSPYDVNAQAQVSVL